MAGRRKGGTMGENDIVLLREITGRDGDFEVTFMNFPVRRVQGESLYRLLGREFIPDAIMGYLFGMEKESHGAASVFVRTKGLFRKSHTCPACSSRVAAENKLHSAAAVSAVVNAGGRRFSIEIRGPVIACGHCGHKMFSTLHGTTFTIERAMTDALLRGTIEPD